MSDSLKELGGYIEAKRPDCVLAWDATRGELNVDVAPAKDSNVSSLAISASNRFITSGRPSRRCCSVNDKPVLAAAFLLDFDFAGAYLTEAPAVSIAFFCA